MYVFVRVFTLLIVSAMTLVACSTTSVNGPDAGKSNASNNSQSSTNDPNEHVDGFFVVPETNFSQYRQIIVPELQLDNIVVRKPASMSKSTSWTLSEDQKRNFRQSYIGAVVGHMVADGVYRTAIDPGENVLFLQAGIVQIVPFTSSSTGGPTPASMRPESEAMVTITIELFDSQTNRLVASLTDSYNFGALWDENNQLVNSAPIHNGFDFWLSYLRQELDVLSRRR